MQTTTHSAARPRRLCKMVPVHLCAALPRRPKRKQRPPPEPKKNHTNELTLDDEARRLARAAVDVPSFTAFRAPSPLPPPPPLSPAATGLEDELPEIVALLQEVADLGFHALGVDDEVAAGLHVRRVEAHVVHEALDHGEQPPCTDVLYLPVDGRGGARDLAHGLFLEHEVHALHGDELHLLPDEVVHGLREDAVEVVLRELRKLHADGQAALELGEEVRGLRHVEGAGGHEEDVVRVHVAVLLQADGAPLEQRQQVALHTLVAGVRAAVLARVADLVDLVDEDDAVLLGGAHGLAHDVRAVRELFHLQLLQDAPRLAHFDLPPLRAPALPAHEPEEVLHLHRHLVVPRAAARTGLARGEARRHVNCDVVVLEVARDEALVPVRLLALLELGADERAVDLLVHRRLDVRAVLLLLALLHQRHGVLHQVADDAVDVAAVEAHLGELGRLDLYEGRITEARDAARDLRLAAAGGPDHEYVLGHDLGAQRLRQPVPPPPVAHGDGHGALRVRLAHNVPVQVRHDVARPPEAAAPRAAAFGLG
mmetsp:Transcript_24383/g.76469  ORF Transcript_24383/g.76469 Transcript_24383/m.76469 type:complete len:539 (+) Transcript_24383:104-1720(+)